MPMSITVLISTGSAPRCPNVRKAALAAHTLTSRWRTWEEKEAPLRRGRGWYPALVRFFHSPHLQQALMAFQDRHFLELLVISEIHCLSNPLRGVSPTARASQIHRHATRVRRVASERIGLERLRAYCDRVKEAFESYVGGAWGVAVHPLDEDERGRPIDRRPEDHTDRSERSTSTSPSPSRSNEDELRTPSEEKQIEFPVNDPIQIDPQPAFDVDTMDVDIAFDERKLGIEREGQTVRCG